MSLRIMNQENPPPLLRFGEALYARPGLMIRRHGRKLWVKTDHLASLLRAYEQNPGCYPGGWRPKEENPNAARRD